MGATRGQSTTHGFTAVRPMWWLLVVIALALALAAPESALGASKDWRLGYYEQMDSPNPIALQASSAQAMAGMSYDYLINYSSKDLSPDTAHSLADSYRVSDGGLTWTFKLRRGITWSDGQPFTSADVKWTYEQVLQDKATPLGIALVGVRAVETPDPYTVVLKMSQPNPDIPVAFVPILPEHVWSKLPEKQIQTGQGPIPNVTTGPFIITSFDPNGTTILKANPRYRFAEPKVSRILWIKYSDQAGMLRDLQLGQLDAIEFGKPNWVGQVRNNPSIKAWSSPAPSMTYIGFNSCPPQGAGPCQGVGPSVDVKVVQDVAIRKALDLVLNRAQIIQDVYFGQATAGLTGIIPPYYRAYASSPQGSDQPQIASARSALAAGGWNCSTDPCTKGTTKAEFKLLYDPQQTKDAALAQRVRAEAATANIKVDLDPVSLDAQNALVDASGSKPGTFRPNYDALVSTWGGLPASPIVFMELLITGGPFPETFYSNRQYDHLMGQAQSITDPAQRAALFRQASAVAMQELPYVPVASQNNIALARTDTWHNYQPAPAGDGLPWGVNPLQVAALVPGAASGGGGGSAGLIVGIVVAAIVVLVSGGLLVTRRRRALAGSERGWTES